MPLRNPAFVAAILAAAPATFAQTYRRAQERPELRAALESAGPASRALLVEVHPRSGMAQRLRGPLGLTEGPVEALGEEFLRRYGPAFGARADELSPAEVRRFSIPRAPIYLQWKQQIHGFEVEHHGLTLRIDHRGRADSAHGILASLEGIAPPAVSEFAAIERARAALAALGLTDSDLRRTPHVAARIARAGDRGIELFYGIDAIEHRGLTPWRVEVNAATSDVTRVFVNASTGIGEYVFNGQTIPFFTGAGKGTAYKNVADALIAKETMQSLRDLSLQDVVPGLADKGKLFGRFGHVLDDLSNDAFSTTRTYPFSDSVAQQADLFDQSNLYYWLTTLGFGFSKNLAPLSVTGHLGIDYSIPTVVNIPDLANAFFTTADLGLGHGPGFFAFGDLSDSTGSDADDFSRDPTVTAHEYFHGIAAGFGFLFGANPLDTPPRAVNEAIADFYAASLLKDPRIGRVIATNGIGDLFGIQGDALRSVAEPRILPDDLAIINPNTSLPEEHEAGLIFAATLWNLRQHLKNPKLAEQIILSSMPDWPSTTAEVGFVTVTSQNAVDAYAAFYADCLLSVLSTVNAFKGFNAAARATGPLLKNGALGSLTFATEPAFDLSAIGGTVKFNSEFLEGISMHSIAILLAAGQRVDVTAVGNKQDGTPLDFLLSGSSNPSATQPKITKGLSVSQKGTIAGTNGILFVDLIVTDGLPGRYTLTIRAY
ncbi:MAG: hypothetical protein JNJ88_17740 [Planctomycetes bacterium]|nr:hypothetical protein [Planctomycetota bacterium]